jgi:hypothetical protein
MALWVEFTINKAGAKAFVNLEQAIVVRQAPPSEPGVTLIEFSGGKISVMESVADVMATVPTSARA